MHTFVIPAAYHEYRCKECNKLFFKGILVDSEIEVKCKKCGHVEVLKGVDSNKLICLKHPCPNRIVFPVGESK